VLPESPLDETDHGLVPTGKGWFVLNARDAPWRERGGRGFLCEFEDPEGDRSDFSQLGVNITVLAAGEPMSMYHWEVDQEDFLVVSGEAVLVVEGEERRLGPWDFVHCPPRTVHVIVGAGTGPCVVVAIGARVGSTGPSWGGYTVDETALRHGAGVERETTVPAEAYARFPKSTLTSYPKGLLGD
jgi:mannose-6-phosphate isomerase-like protein (cupin superfamily)